MSTSNLHSDIIGKKAFIVTITNYYVGVVVDVEVLPHVTFYVLEQATWVASTDRFHVSMATGKFKEQEPYPAEMRVRVNEESIVSMVADWPHDLPVTAND